MSEISVVLAVHNRIGYTRNFLKSVYKQTFPDFNVIVVDDGSTDGTSEMVVNEFPATILIKGDGNLWWSKSTNLAVQKAIFEMHSKYICTVNDDTELDESFLQELYNVVIRYPKSVVGCYSYDINQKNKLLYDGSTVNWLTGGINVLNSLKKENEGLFVIPLTYYIGRGVLIPSSVYKEIGYYDSINFPQSWADNELVFRAKRKGYKVYAASKAKQYIYAEESKHLKLRRSKSLTNYLDYLFKQQGGGNVLSFSKYVYISYPWYGIPISLVTGVLKRIVGYWKQK